MNTGPGRLRRTASSSPKHEDQHLGDQEQLDVDPELLDELGQRLPEDRPVEERLLDAGPAGRVDDDEREQPEDDDRRDDRDQRAIRVALAAQPEAGPSTRPGRRCRPGRPGRAPSGSMALAAVWLRQGWKTGAPALVRQLLVVIRASSPESRDLADGRVDAVGQRAALVERRR